MLGKITQLFLYNFIVTFLLFTLYIFSTPDINTIFSFVALISDVAIIYIVLFLILFFLLLPIKNLKIKLSVIGVILLTLHFITISDIILYKIFKYHINGLVLNVIFTPGGIEALDVSVSNLIYFSAICSIFLILEIFFIVKLLKSNFETKKYFSLKYIIIILLLFIIADKGLYAYFDIKGNDSVIKVKKLYPLYLPFTCKKFFRKVLHLKVKKNHNITIKNSRNTLHYPLSKIKFKRKRKYPNIVWILLDAWRADAFNKILTPNIYKFSQNSLIFTNHKSGGIATRFGIFSLFYGIYGTYWHRFLENKKSPVFLDTLQKLHYNFKILTSSPLTFPEFDQTVFVKLLDKLPKKRPGKTAAMKDENITEEFVSWLDNSDNFSEPFFAFIFMDAPHAKSYLPKFRKYKADKSSNYLIVNKKNVTKIKNAYLNAVISDDFLVKKILTSLQKRDLMKNTVILISADHGEEFYEHGHLGHTSAFTPEQNNVPLILYIPGNKHKEFSKLTCHYDIVPTIMNLLGIISPVSDYSNGVNLLDNNNIHKYVIASSWTNFAVIYNDYRFIFSMASYKAGLFEIRDNDFKLIKDKSLFESRIKDFAKITRDLSKF